MADSYYNDTYNMGVDSDGNSFYYNTDTGITYYSNGDSSYYNSYTDITYYSNGDSSYYNSSYDITYYSSGDSSYYNSTYGMRYGGPSSSSEDTSSSSSDSSYDYSYSSSSYSGSSSGYSYSYYSSPKSAPLTAHDKELGKYAGKVLAFLGIGFAIFCVVVLAIAIIGSTGAFDFLLGPAKLSVTGINCTVTSQTEFPTGEKTDFDVVPDPGYEFAYFISGDKYIYESEIKPDRDAQTVVAVCLPEGKGMVVTENSITIPISTDQEALGSEYFYSGSDAAVFDVNNFALNLPEAELKKMLEKYSTVTMTFTIDIREESRVLSQNCSMYGQDLTNSRQIVGISFDSDIGYVTFDHGGDDIVSEYATHTQTIKPLPATYLETFMRVFFRIDNNYVNGTEDCPAWYMKNAYITFEFSN